MLQTAAYFLAKVLFVAVTTVVCYFTGKGILLLCRSGIGIEPFAKMKNLDKWGLDATYRRGQRKFFHAQTLVLVGGAFWSLGLFVWLFFIN